MSRPVKYVFRLYVAGDAPNSAQARTNLTNFCDTYLPDCHEIEVIDVLKSPMRALTDNVLMTPTLLKLSPLPSSRVVGALSQFQTVLDSLGLQVPIK